MKNYIVLLLSFFSVVFFSCNNDKDDNLNPGSLELRFESIIGNTEVSGSQEYTNISGEKYTINELKYIISNIELIRADGSTFTYPVEESYFVVDIANASTQLLKLENIPAGNYERVKFGFGVDPTKYPIESGTLNFIPTAEEAGMLWSWSAGYKFIKLEGNYIPEGETEQAPYIVHVGSHGATLDNYKEITVTLLDDIAGVPFPINSEVDAQKKIFFDVSRIFDGPNTIRIHDKPDIQVDPVNAPKIAENISSAFFVPQG